MDKIDKIAITSLAFIIIIFSMIIMMTSPERGESSATPLNFGAALMFLIVFWLVLSFVLLRKEKYRPYGWYPPNRICF
jgi:amino acid permease